MPFCACPGTVQRYSYLPALANVIANVAVLPDAICAVALPAQAFGVIVPLLLEQNFRSWGRTPLLTNLKSTSPCLTDFAESVKANSDGLPAVTVIVVAAFAAGWALAGIAQSSVKLAETAARTRSRTCLTFIGPPRV